MGDSFKKKHFSPGSHRNIRSLVVWWAMGPTQVGIGQGFAVGQVRYGGV